MNNSLQSFIPQNQDMIPQKHKKGNEILAKVILGFFYIGIIVVAVGCFYFFTRKTSDFYIVDKNVSLSIGSSYKTKLHVKQDIDINGEDGFLVSWLSSNPDVVSVDSNGVLNALSAGIAEIKAVLYDGSTSVMAVTVGTEQDKIETVTIDFEKDSYNLEVGNSLPLKLIVTPRNLDYGVVTWSSNNKNVTTVDENGMVTAKSKGTASITAELINGEKAVCKINVSEVSTTDKVKIVENNKSIVVGSETTLKMNKSKNENLSWTSSNPEIVDVNSEGKITAKGNGIATITVVSDTGEVSTSTITVTDKIIDVDSITLSRTEYSMYVGDTYTLDAGISPDNATDKTIIWTSSNTSVATVNDGVVIAKGAGKTVITASTNNDKTAKITINVNSKNIDVSEVIIDNKTIKADIGSKIQIITSILPENATDKKLTYSSNNKKIVSIDSKGVASILAQGTAVITVKSSNGKTASVTIVASPIEVAVSSVKLNKTSATLDVGDKITLSSTISPSNATNKTVIWSSNNAGVATVNNGVVTAKSSGTATITSMSSNGKKATCTITVKNKIIDVTSVVINKTSANLYLGDTLTLKASISPSDATNKSIKWTSSNKSVATVNNGVVTPISTGTVIITASSNNGKKATCTVYVMKKTINVSSISLSQQSAVLYAGDSITLKSNISPSDATNKNVTWTSSNTGVATVNNGVVTAKSSGTAVITVTSSNGKQAKCTVTVKNREVSVTGVSINQSSINVLPGNTYLLQATVSPSNATNKNVTWTSSNTNVATVASNGVVTGKSVGKATITVKTNNGKTSSCVVNVVSNDVAVTGISLSSTFASLSIGNTYNLSATVSPSNATNKSVTWTSSNTGVATVNNGVVTAVNGGTAVITAKTSNGKTATATISVKYRAASESEMRNSYGKLVSSRGTGSYYAYAPSILVKDNQWYIYSCQNKDASQTYDHIYLNTSSLTLILAPGSGWDSYHVCDPSVVEGNFKYNGATYKYAMAYLGINTPTGNGNNIGLSLSNSLTSGWVRVGNQPFISSNVSNRWGVGQPSLIYVNNKLIMFYTNDTGVGSGMQVRIINPNTMQIEASGNLSTKNTTWMHNADFAYKDNRLYVAYEGNESTTTGDIISDTIQIRSAYIANYTNISEYANLNWEYENTISKNVSGEKRNTNAGLFRNQYGGLFSRQVGFTATDSGYGNGHFSYHIYKSSF